MNGRLYCTQCGSTLEGGPECPCCSATSEYWEVDPPLLPEGGKVAQGGLTPSAPVVDSVASSPSAVLSGIVRDLFSDSFLLEESESTTPCGGLPSTATEQSSVVLDPDGVEQARSTTVEIPESLDGDGGAGSDSLNPDGEGDKIAGHPTDDSRP